MNLWIVIILAIVAAVAFPLLELWGVEVRSLYVVATVVFLGLLTGVVFWRFLKRLFRRLFRR